MKKNVFSKTRLVAEIGCNHQGNLNTAYKMLNTLKHFCSVQYVKFQKRTPKELLTDKEYNSPHPNPINSFGKTYGEHRENLEFNISTHKKLIKYCNKIGLTYCTSVWDLTSAKQIIKTSCTNIKIPSACNNNSELLEFLFKNFKNNLHISMGMTTKKEENNIFKIAKKFKRNKEKLIIYACTSSYPAKDDDVNLYEIKRLKKKFGKLAQIGFSGHHNGIAIDIAASSLGAKWIERHFTLDRTLKGTDHAASLEPDGIRRLNRDLISLPKVMTYKKKEILQSEKLQRKKLKYKKI
tara:strand:+ start:5913 stop:6794 length:882 start_codon:yes stop_codon:yes gene_type:complete